MIDNKKKINSQISLAYKFMQPKVRYWSQFLNISIAVFIFLLPYWLFDAKLFIGGDDSRLFYIFPDLWLRNMAWFSWFNFSTTGLHNPQHFIIPLIVLLAGLEKVLPQIVVINLAFSTPIFLGFIFFQKMFHALVRDKTNFNNTKIAAILGGLFFIMSPIIWTITLAPFLYAAWLIALFPILFFFFFRYIQTGMLRYVLYNSVASIILALSLYSVPWVLGLIIPLAISLVMCGPLYRLSEISVFLRRVTIFLSALILAQFFWLIPFVMSMLDKSGSFASVALSTPIRDTFVSTVTATMFDNNLIFPVLNFFHRSIVFNFDWNIKSAFESVYDNIYFLNLIFIVIVIKALLSYRYLLEATDKKIFFILVFAWLIALFLFTVNIGPLKYVFLMFGDISGFAIFRNAYDKFAIGFVFIYATLLSFSLWAILNEATTNRNNYKNWLIGLCSIALFISSIPIKSLVNKPLWKTKNIGTVINIPIEYLNFIKEVKGNTQVTSNILSVPFAYPAYAIIKDESSSAVFAGGSPLKLLTSINDFSGFMSLGDVEARKFHEAVLGQKFSEVKQFLHDHNIGYVVINHNIPKEVMQSYIFSTYPDQAIFNKKLNSWLLPNFLGTKLSISNNGSYELYRTNIKTAILESKDLVFKKISPVKYKLSIRNVTEHHMLIFRDTFNSGWKLYLDKVTGTTFCQGINDGLPADMGECTRVNHLFEWEDIQYLWKKNLSFKHLPDKNGISNVWIVDKKLISSFGRENYVLHNDGAIDVEMTLFFYPQLYFYIGTIVTIITLFMFSFFAYRQARVSRVSKSDILAN
jgi:hypothetical protein